MGTASGSLEPDLFEACLSLPPEQREAFLDDACGANTGLRHRVLRLLDAHDQMESSGGLAGLGHPTRIESYQIVGVLGEGGMGVVYEALQTEPVRRHVAVKVIRTGMDSHAVVARFAAERQALAVMDHDSIARVYDAGETRDGRPWFAMELVRGEPINEYCDTRNLSIRERLHLFVHLCYAIQHAHQKGLIHRDLKPSNVLVVEHGRYAQPKVIDFGIAKAVDNGMAALEVDSFPHNFVDAPALTHHGQAVGTPAYMSPEQASMGGMDVDTRSDIFSLGVMLYELLCGVLPEDHGRTGPATHIEKLRRLEAVPPRPSRRFLALPPDRRVRIAALRSGTPAQLRRELVRDLDWIALKATQLDREQRYATACQFAYDIENYLRNWPLMAHPGSVFYRTAKFVKRNRIFVAAGLVATLAVSAGGIGLALGLVRATRAEEAARRDAVTAERITELMQGIFVAADPGRNGGRPITAAEMLEDGTERVRRELRSEPAVQSRMLATLSRIHLSFGQYDRARLLAEQAIHAEQGRRSPDTAAIATALMESGAASARLGRVGDARAAFERSLVLYTERFGADSVEAAEAKHRLGSLLWQLDDLPSAKRLHQEALNAREAKLGLNHVDTGKSLRRLAFVLEEEGNHAEALRLLERAQRIFESAYGVSHPLVADNLDSIAVAQVNLKRFEEARRNHERSLAIRRTALGDTRGTVAYSYLNLARLAEAESSLSEARSPYGRGMSLRETSIGKGHLSTTDLVESLAIFEARSGNLSQSERLFRRALNSYVVACGDAHRETLENRRNLAILMTMRGRLEPAVRQLRIAYASGYGKQLALDDKAFEPLERLASFRRLKGEWQSAARGGIQ